MDPDEIQAFTAKAKDQGRTKAALLRVLVRAYVKKSTGGNFRKGGSI
jgi:hypothetical protein